MDLVGGLHNCRAGMTAFHPCNLDYSTARTHMQHNIVALHKARRAMKYLSVLFERLFAPGLEMLGAVPERALREIFLYR